LLSQVSRHEDLWGSGGLAPHILNLRTRWRWVVRFMPRSLYPEGRAFPLLEIWVIPRDGLDWVAEKKMKYSLASIGNRTPVVQPAV